MSEGENGVPLPGENVGERAMANPGGEGGPAVLPGKPPPTYQEVGDVNAAPPSYDSLYGEFRQVDSPKGFAVYMRRLTGIIIGTVAAAIAVGVITLIPIAMIVIGSLNLKNCPAERYIPIFLIVGGVFGLFKCLANFYYRMKAKKAGEERNPEENVTPNPFDGIVSCFLVAWFIAGSVWVYRIYTPDFEKNQGEFYCDKLTFYFTFCLITIIYVMMALFLCMTCCGGCFALCCRKSNDS